MNHNSLVSVVVPAYNAEKYIEETIFSILNQTHKNLEVIVVDDGSTDGTASIIEKLSSTDNRIILIKQKNSGVSTARNKGINLAKGEYVALCDADDIWLDKHILLILEKFDENKKIDLVQSGYQIFNKDEVFKEAYLGEEGQIFEGLLEGNFNWFTGPSGIIIKKNVFEKVNGFDIELMNNADHFFFVSVSRLFLIGKTNEITWLYRIHDKSMHLNINRLELETLLEYKKFKQKKWFKSYFFKKRCFSKMYLMLAGSFWPTNKFKSLKYIIFALLSNPLIIRVIVLKMIQKK